jgi:hypothetical protein
MKETHSDWGSTGSTTCCFARRVSCELDGDRQSVEGGGVRGGGGESAASPRPGASIRARVRRRGLPGAPRHATPGGSSLDLGSDVRIAPGTASRFRRMAAVGVVQTRSMRTSPQRPRFSTVRVTRTLSSRRPSAAYAWREVLGEELGGGIARSSPDANVCGCALGWQLGGAMRL